MNRIGDARCLPVRRPIAAALALVLALPPAAPADEPAPPARIDPAGVPGSLVIVGGGGTPKSVRERFFKLAGGEAGRLVIIPTASEYADRTTVDEYRSDWSEYPFASIHVRHTRDRAIAATDEFLKPIREATAIWFGGGDQSDIARAYLGTPVEDEIRALLARGGVVGGTSAGAAIQSRLMITGGNPVATTGVGLDLLPGAVVDQHFLRRNRKPRLAGVLAAHPDKVGVGVDERAAMVVSGRSVEVVGDSVVTILFAGAPERGIEPREIVLKPGDRADWVSYLREARDRLGEPFPPPAEALVPPRVDGPGALVIVGGGGLPRGLFERFVALAGGPDAPIVILPTAQEPPFPKTAPEERLFRRAGARRVATLSAVTPEELAAPENAALLAEARGVWFGGGRQWRFVDAYEGTPAVEAFRAVLARGGVIGGSSAGATIQGDYLVRGSPLRNTIMMADGYKRGFAFLPGVAIDQHFAQRDRFRDLAAVVDAHPQLLGVGIDETTAIIVQGSVAEVVGEHNVHLYLPKTAPSKTEDDESETPSRSRTGKPDLTLAPGDRYDLVAKQRLEPASPAEPAAPPTPDPHP